MSGRAARLLIGPIRFYRRQVSPSLPATCRYQPSCSAYAIEALQVHGFWRGSWLTVRRLGRCQPYSRHGPFDPVPPARREPAVGPDSCPTEGPDGAKAAGASPETRAVAIPGATIGSSGERTSS